LNFDKLLLTTQIYDMHRLTHNLSSGSRLTLRGPEEDHNAETGAELAAAPMARLDVPYAQRAAVARSIEDLTVSEGVGWYSIISLDGGGSPDAMKGEIHRRYFVAEREEPLRQLTERGIAKEAGPALAQPGQCCEAGCRVPQPPVVLKLKRSR